MSIKTTKPAQADPVHTPPYTMSARKVAAQEQARDNMSDDEYAEALHRAKSGY